jgi:hypothetical protein
VVDICWLGGRYNIFYFKFNQEDMSKLENWTDLFKYNKELLEDDYNQGQGVVIKTKSKASDNVTVSLCESGEENAQSIG